MARAIEKKQVELTFEERTWRVEIFCEKGNDPVVRFHREIITQTADRSKIVSRTLTELAETTFDTSKGKLTGADLAAIISEIGDILALEDDEKAANSEQEQKL